MRWRMPLLALVVAGTWLVPAEHAQAAGPAAVAAAANCTNPSTIAFPGGVQVQMTCDGRQVGGVGTTIPAAETNARAFADLAAQTGVRCTLPSVLSTSNVSAVPGGFVIRFNCELVDAQYRELLAISVSHNGAAYGPVAQALFAPAAGHGKSERGHSTGYLLADSTRPRIGTALSLSLALAAVLARPRAIGTTLTGLAGCLRPGKTAPITSRSLTTPEPTLA